MDFTTLIVHMVKKKTRQQSVGANVVHLPQDNPYDSKRKSELAWLWDEIKKGDFSPDKLTLMGDDGSMVITMLHMAFKIISSPLHPDNNWRSLVETMSYGGKTYYRLATEIPVSIMGYWKKHGHPPSCSWGLGDSGYRHIDKPIAPSSRTKSKFSASAVPPPKKAPKQAQPVATLYKGKPIKNLIRHPQNPFRNGSGYGVLVDLIVWASPGILKEPLLNMFCAVTRKSRIRATFDLSVIESAQPGKRRHKSCRTGFEITKENGFYSIRFG